VKKIALFLLFGILLLYGCETSELQVNERIEAGEGLPVEFRSLSEIQVEACNAAHEAGTCDTRLSELGIVLKEDCCEVLGKCC
jgi:hypothetical protein